MKRIAEDIKKGSFARVYLLYGPESYMRRLYLKNLLKALEAGESSMNFTSFKEDNCSEEDIINICDTMPFFAEHRVVLLDDAGIFKKKPEKLTDYIAKLPEYDVLIINEAAADKRSRLYKACAKYERSIEFPLLDPAKIQNEVLRKLAAAGKKIRKNTMDIFLAGAGNDMGYIDMELAKLISYTEGRDEITEKDIQDICSPVIENRVFDLVSAVASGNKKEALERYRELKALKEAPMKMLRLIQRQFSQLLDIKQLSEEGMSQTQIAQLLKIHPYAVKKSFPLTKRYSQQRLKEALEDMISIEADVKTGRLSDTLSVELVIMKYSS